MNELKLSHKKFNLTPQSILKTVINNALIFVIIGMVIFTSISTPTFFSLNTLKNILANTTVRFMIAIGVSGCLIIKGTDLSAGRMVGATSILTAVMMQNPNGSNVLYPAIAGSNVIVALIVAVGFGTLLGFVNGCIVAFMKIPAFIATLGTQIILYGINMILSKNIPIGGLDDAFTSFGGGSFGIGEFQLPYIFLILVVVFIAMWFLYKRTTHGKYMYAIGGNEIAAEVSGVNTNRVQIRIFALAGAFYGLAGFLLAAKVGSTSVNAGMAYELEAIAAATIGGVSTTGGVGTVPGVFLGVLVFEMLKTCLQFLHVDPAVTNILQGIVIIIAVGLDVRRTMRRK